MSYSASIYCPHCHRYTALRIAQTTFGRDALPVDLVWAKSQHAHWWMGVCNGCQEPVLVLNSGSIVHPSPRPSQTNPAIPNSIRKDLDEAKTCLSAGAFRGCAVMARRSMQSAALEKGASGDSLVKQIDSLASSGKITTDLKDWAHAVRWVGNDAAHPGGIEVTVTEASDVLELAEQFLHVLYVAPALAAGLKKRLGK